jgi:hypothetical protein
VEPLWIAIVVIVAIVMLRLLAGCMDADRVEHYLGERGCELVERHWDPFGPGWFGEKDSRIYRIVYRDREGRLHRAHVKTSLLSGVYLTNDEVADSDAAPPGGEETSLEEENRQLRERIRQLEQGRP